MEFCQIYFSIVGTVGEVVHWCNLVMPVCVKFI